LYDINVSETGGASIFTLKMEAAHCFAVKTFPSVIGENRIGLKKRAEETKLKWAQ
jgi:hypothetical protein